MQIRKLILYGNNGQTRQIEFDLGKVNIITGRSKSGKSAIGDIIDYCLGSTSCNIADGVIRDNIAWYGLLLQFPDIQIFVARKNPDSGQHTTTLCYMELGDNLEIPSKDTLVPNCNVDSIVEELSSRIGISENLHKPPEGHSRPAISATIRHALYYCFQNQDEIAAKNYLFHRQSEDFISQTIRDTLPYFLGAIDEDTLSLENENATLKRKLNLERRKLSEIQALSGGGTDRAIKLISEARQVGLLDAKALIDYADHNALFTLLSDIVQNWTPNTILHTGMDKLSFLQSQLLQVEEELEALEFTISEVKKYIHETVDFETEAHHQKVRLESIGLFEKLDFSPTACPLCSGKLEHELPSINEMKKSIQDLDQSISTITRKQPQLREYYNDLVKLREEKRTIRRGLKAEIDGLYERLDNDRKIRDLNSRCAKVIGRISLWLESMSEIDNTSSLTQTIHKLETRLNEISELLNPDVIEDRKQSALSRIQVDMTNWAKQLELEHYDCPYRLDLKKVTVVVDKPERPVPLKQLGSGSNWVGVHLITYFALQKYFIAGHRPVPCFLFIDQPSQVYFPSESDEQRTDWNEVEKIYRFIFDRVTELNGGLQAIIVDHADLNSLEFKEHIKESWLDQKSSLVPIDWITT